MAVQLDGSDATLDLSLSGDGLTAVPHQSAILSRLWSGIRANSSASGGKLFFIVKVVEVPLQSGDNAQPECLIGISTRATAVSQLGSGSSCAYASSGQKWTGSKAESFATSFTVGDQIGCFLDLDSEPGSVSFSHNGKWLGNAFEVPQPDSSQNALFPHILLKGLRVEVDFVGDNLQEGSNWPQQAGSYVSWTTGVQQDNASCSSHAKPQTASDCEVMIMVGLPGCGKTTWATRYIANHPEKRYAVLSIDGMIKQLKLGINQGRSRPKPADAKTQQVAEQAYKELLGQIKDVPRNYVIDDSNVYADARSEMVSQFRQAGFKTRAAVIVLPDSSLFRRQRKQHQEEGKSVPETTIADMRANFSMPEVGDVFQEVFFVEAKPPEANDIAAAQAEAAKAALPMLKARSSGGRQTRSRTAKLTPKRASTASKPESTAAVDCGATSAVPNGEVSPAAKEPVTADGVKSTPSKTESAAVDAPKDAAASKAAAGDPQASTDEAAAPQAEVSPQGASADPKDKAVGMEVDVPKAESQPEEPAAAGTAAAEPVEAAAAEPVEAAAAEPVEAAAAAADEIVEAEIADEPAKSEPPVVSEQPADEPLVSKEEDQAAAAEPIDEEGGEQAEAMETDSAQEAEATKDAQQAVQEEPHQADTEEVKEAIEDEAATAEAKSQATAQEAAEKAAPAASEAAAPEAAKAEEASEKQAEPKKAVAHQEKPSVEAPAAAKDTDAPEGRGIKRPAPAPVRDAKQARTNKAAGRLLGNIRNQGTVKRTVIKGRVGARPHGMRLPPPISEHASPGKQAATAAGNKDKSGDAGTKDGNKAGAGLTDILPQLLPVEHDTKTSPQKGTANEAAPKATADKGNKPAPRASTTAKATTPKRQDQVTTKSAGARSGDKGRQDQGRGQHSSARPRQAAKGGHRALPPPISARQGTGRQAGKGRSSRQNLGPRNAGVQKVRGPPSRQDAPRDRAARHGPGPAAPRHHPANRPGPHPIPGRALPAGTGRPAPGWERFAPPRDGPVPARLPLPVARVDRRPPAARGPRGSLGENQRAPNTRAPTREPVGGFPVGRQSGPPAGRPSRGPLGPPHTASRGAPPRARTDRPIPPPGNRRVSAPPIVPPDNRFDGSPANRGAAPFHEPVRAARPGSHNPRHNPPGARLPPPVGPRSNNARVAASQPFSPPPVGRQQHPSDYRSPVPPVQLPPPRLAPLPAGGGPSGPAGGGYGPRDSHRRDTAGHVDRSRSRSRGPAGNPRAHPYSDRPGPKGRQPAAQQLRSATYPQEQPLAQQYSPAGGAPVQTHPPPRYDQPGPAYASEPRRAPASGDRYGPGPAARGPPSQRWQGSPAQPLEAVAGSGYQPQREPVARSNYGRQEYGQHRGPDAPGNEARSGQRMNRRPDRGARDRSNPRSQPANDQGRYPTGHMEQEYAPGPAANGYMPRDAAPPSRGHGYVEDQGYIPPQQHSQAPSSRYDAQGGGYAPPAAQEPHQPVYGSGPVAPQGYTTSSQTPAERQPYYPQQQRPARAPPAQQQQYTNAPANYSEPSYASGPPSYAGGSQGVYADYPPGQASRGGYASAPVHAPRQRGEEYEQAYTGHNRPQGYAAQARPAQNAPVSHAGGHGARGGSRGGGAQQQWAPSPREASYGGPSHSSGAYGGQPNQRQGGYAPSPAGYGNSRAPQDQYPPQQQVGSSRMHAPQGSYGRHININRLRADRLSDSRFWEV